MAGADERYAVVTGSNKGIGLEICRQLASNGSFVVLTARDEKRGLEAVEKLKKSGLHNIIFHQLDVTNPATISSLADFIKAKFGKLDILVNNAGISGVKGDAEAIRGASGSGKEATDWTKMLTQSYELAEECLNTNYYGAKKMCETLLPLLHESTSPKIVNVSSGMGKLKNVSNEWAKAILSDGENLSEEKVDQVLKKFLEDYKDGSFAAKGWPSFMPAYILSKVALNAYTKVLARKYPNIIINCVCPGYVKTDINYHNGVLTVEEGAASPVRLTLVPNGSPSGRFFVRMEESEF